MDQLPVIPEAERLKFLVVSIVSLSEDQRIALESTTNYCLSMAKQQSEEAVKTPLYAYIPGKLPHRDKLSHVYDKVSYEQSSVRRVYEVAQMARLSGWEELAIFDASSLQTLEDMRKAGPETTRWNLLTVAFRRQAYSTQLVRPHGATHTLLRRERAGPSVNNLASLNPLIDITCRPQSGVFSPLAPLYIQGAILRDPSKPVFSTENIVGPQQTLRVNVIEAALDSRPGLPIEIKHRIHAMMKEDDPLENLSAAPQKTISLSTHLQIFLLERVCKDELQWLHDSIKADTDNMDLKEPIESIILFEWIHSGRATRRDVSRLWDRVLHEGINGLSVLPTMLFLYPRMWKKERRLGMILYDGGRLSHCYLARKVDLRTALDVWQVDVRWKASLYSKIVNYDLENAERNGDGEYFFQLNHPFYCLSLVHRKILPPLFFLVKHVDGNPEFNNLVAEICHTPGGKSISRRLVRKFAVKPWRNEKDGTVNDMWLIFRDVLELQYTHHQSKQLLFVDRRSFEDWTMIRARAVPFDVAENGRTKQVTGLRYERLEARHYYNILIGRRRRTVPYEISDEGEYLPPKELRVFYE